MDQPPTVAFTAFADTWPRAIKMKIGATLCAIGCRKVLYFNVYLAGSFCLSQINLHELKLICAIVYI